jgi:glycosyltransferase involved in cell wall biosynthesis
MKELPTILHVIDTTGPGGAETVFVNLAEATQNKGYSSIALIRGKGWVYQELKKRGVETILLDCKGSFNLLFLWRLIKLIKFKRIDVIQTHLLGSNIYCAMAGFICRKQVYATFHGGVDVSTSERFIKLKCLILNLGVTKFISVSKALEQEIMTSGLLNTKKSLVISNGVDTDRYFKRNSTPLRTELTLPADAILVGSLGNVRPAKSYETLIEAAALALIKEPNLHFIIAGDTSREPIMSDIRSLIVQRNIFESVHFIGYRSDSANFLGQMDLFLLTSSSEGFSIATIEALATGLPIVATRCGGPEEILQNLDETVGIYLVDQNKEQISAAILAGVENKNYRTTDLALSYSFNSSVDRYLDLYNTRSTNAVKRRQIQS